MTRTLLTDSLMERGFTADEARDAASWWRAMTIPARRSWIDMADSAAVDVIWRYRQRHAAALQASASHAEDNDGGDAD